jgi:uncharacterized Rossmann fold enzyme
MTPKYQPAWSAMLEGLAEDAAAGRLTPDSDRRRRQERTDRATTDLSDPPAARSHAERMAAARGVHVHGDNMRTPASDRRRIVKHRDSDNV